MADLFTYLKIRFGKNRSERAWYGRLIFVGLDLHSVSGSVGRSETHLASFRHSA